MRTRTFVQIISVAMIVAVSALWMKSRTTALALRARLSTLNSVRADTARALELKRNDLRSALTEANRSRPSNAVTPSNPRAQLFPLRALPSSLVMGEWRSSRAWHNEGQSTAQGTVATLLWAAAGGDLTTLMRLIAYDDASRKQAQILFERLPPAARQEFPTPEALVAGLTIQAVPSDGAQLSWFHQRDADHATVGLLLGLPKENSPTGLGVTPSRDNAPPTIASPTFTQFAALSLTRTPNGWQVIIPAAAVERLAHRLNTPAS